MDRRGFLDRQAALVEKLRHALPRSARHKQLQAELDALVRDELRLEVGAAFPTEAGRREEVPEPPADLFARVGDGDGAPQPREERGPYGGQTPYWVEQ